MNKDQPQPLRQWLGDTAVANHDELTPGSDQVMLSMGFVATVILLPFVVNNFLQGRVAVGLALAVIDAALALNSYALWHRRRPPVPYAWLFLPFIAGITLATIRQGIPGMLWTFPVVLFCYFVLARRVAHLFCLLILIYTTGLSWFFIDVTFATRLFGSLLLTIFMINIVLKAIADLNRALTSQALTDSLTGAFNRRFMQETLAVTVSRSQRVPRVVSILMIDVDHFKDINDRYGHDAGDNALRRVVELVGTRVRAVDRFSRWGGEEFLLLLEDADLTNALKVAEEIRRLIEASEIVQGQTVTVSIGVSQYQAGSTVEEWLKAADRALYRAKDDGRNRVIGNRSGAG